MSEADARATSLGELSGLLGSWRLSFEAANLSPRHDRAYTDDGVLLARFLAAEGMPIGASNIRREHVEAFIAAELDRTAPASAATRYRSLRPLFNWLEEEGEITVSPMAKIRPPRIREQPAPVSASGSYQMIKDRGSAVGLPDLHPHQLRHCTDSRYSQG
jgi:site-specific recombinase XerC